MTISWHVAAELVAIERGRKSCQKVDHRNKVIPKVLLNFLKKDAKTSFKFCFCNKHACGEFPRNIHCIFTPPSFTLNKNSVKWGSQTLSELQLKLNNTLSFPRAQQRHTGKSICFINVNNTVQILKIILIMHLLSFISSF